MVANRRHVDIGPTVSDNPPVATNTPLDDLARRIRDAIEDYHGGWRPIGAELHALCARLTNHRDFAQVYTKVVTINRVYAAGLARILNHLVDAERHVATQLIRPETADAIEQLLAALDEPTLTIDVAARVVTGHGHLVRQLDTSKNVRSFASKYLHFHRDIVPLYDSLAADQLPAELHRSGTAARRQALRAQLRHVSGGDPEYQVFVADFIALKEAADQAMPSRGLTVKELDHFLWHAWRQAHPRKSA